MTAGSKTPWRDAPWSVTGDCIRDANDAGIADFYMRHFDDATMWANAARAVACVNACAGIPTAELGRTVAAVNAAGEMREALRPFAEIARKTGEFEDAFGMEISGAECRPVPLKHLRRARALLAKLDAAAGGGNG